MEYILLIGYTVGVYLVGVRVGMTFVLKHHDEFVEEDELFDNSKQVNETIDTKIMIHIEHSDVDGYFFVYEQDTKRFMAHGKTWQEVEVRLKERYPGSTFGINEEHAKEIGMI